jgi:DNA-binding NarL/FixJ family response regulator
MISVAIIEDIKDIRIPLTEFISKQSEFLLDISSESIENYFIQYNQNKLPDIVLLDIGLPGILGIDAIAMFKKRIPKADIIMLTINDNSDRIFRALQAGASGYLLKNTPLIKIKETIINLINGKAAMSPEIAKKVIKFFGERNEQRK